MRNLNINETETEGYVRVKKSTQKLLARLIEHHDYNIAFVEIEPEVEPEPEVVVPVVAEENCLSEYEIEAEEIQIITIQKVVAHHFNMTRGQIISNRNFARFVLPRQVGMFLSRKLTSKSLPYIARAFKKADHSTVYHAMEKMKKMIAEDAVFADKVAGIEAALHARSVG